MPTVELVTTANTYRIPADAGVSLLEVFRRSNLPIQGMLPLTCDNGVVSLTHVLKEKDHIRAYALRNVDFNCILPSYTVVPSANLAAEIVRPLQNPANLGILQMSRESGMDYIYQSVEAVLDSYRASQPSGSEIQLALSPGGDGRVLVECIRRYWSSHQDAAFFAVIVAVGFEDEQEHLSAGVELAERFEIPYRAVGVREAADLLGYSGDLASISKAYRSEHPMDEAEVMLTYWVQNLNFMIARDSGRRGVAFGYNQEDVIAERLYQALTRSDLDPLPIRRLPEFDVIAPLAQIPKKLLDSMDVSNSIRNYGLRTPSVSYLRSSLYILSYIIAEQFPAIADILSGPALAADDPDSLVHWLGEQ